MIGDFFIVFSTNPFGETYKLALFETKRTISNENIL